ncbi:hypothetical protein CCH79_00014059, partial [Gambusia affinis]
MAEESVPEGRSLKELSEEELWELINDNRHRISLGVRPCVLLPYLRQVKVLTEVDEDEILSCHNLTNRCMRTSYMLDLLRTQGRNGAIALLEGLMIHYPVLYTHVTGRQPSTEPSRFSGLIKYSELTEYLIRAVTGMQTELQEARNEAGKMSARCSSLESEVSQLMEQEEKCSHLQTENERLQRHLSSLQREVTKLKDEKCDLYIRYTASIEEKSAIKGRLHDLNLQVYQLQMDLQSIQMENEFHKQRSLRSVSSSQTPQLQEEAHKDILQQDLAEAIDSQVELAEHLKSYREENEKLLRDKQGLLNQTEALSLQVQQLSLDCKMQEQKSTVVQSQMKELQVERDQAFQSRDDAQAMIARILAEKDTLRSQLVELQDAVFTLQAKRSPRPRLRKSDVKEISWESPTSSSEECPLPVRQRLRRMDALNPMSLNSCTSESEDVVPSSIRSKGVEPPSLESLRRRQEVCFEDSSLETAETDSVLDDFVLLSDGSEDEQELRPSSSHGSNSVCVSKSSAPPFLVRSRPKAIRVNGRVLSLSLQCDALLSQLSIVGGNKSGVFVHQVTEGGAAHAVGISPGAQIVEVRYKQNSRALRMVLEDSTLEEATWALGQVTGFCQLSLRPRQNDYEALLQQLQSSTMSSGDSFYIRVNLSLPAGASGTLAVSCNNILHVTNTRPAGTEDLWQASQVHPCQLLDLQSGTVPNYYRAQRLLIQTIEDMSFQTKNCQKLIMEKLSSSQAGRENTRSEQKAVRIMLTSSEHAARLQRSEILEEVEPGGNQCYTLQSVEKVMKKGLHCLLPLGLDCVRRLHRSEIFPVIIFIGVSARNARKLKSKLQRSGQTEEQLLACSKSEEPLLDKLPCLYHSMAPDSWCDQNSLLTSLRTIIWEEQRKVVWVEPDLWMRVKTDSLKWMSGLSVVPGVALEYSGTGLVTPSNHRYVFIKTQTAGAGEGAGGGFY